MWGLVLEEISSVNIVNHTGDSVIVSSRICPRLFLHIGPKFPSDREGFFVEIFILLSLVLLGKCGKGAKVGNKWNNWWSVTIFWSVPHPVTLVLPVVESNNFCYVSLINSTVGPKFRLHMWGKSEAFPTSTISSWDFTILCILGPALFFASLLFYFSSAHSPCLLAGCFMSISSKTFYLLLGAPLPILSISGNLIFFIYWLSMIQDY